ncbi:MAG: TSUP family transporter [Granulosicoccus sp.]
MDPLVLVALVVVALVAGFIDAIAGGGGLLTVPALMMAGLSPVSAIATNKLQAVFGTLAASITFVRAGRVDLPALMPAILLAALGSGSAALALRYVDQSVLDIAIPILLLGAALYFAFSPRMEDVDKQARLGRMAFALGPAMLIGLYDGAFGPGAGAFYTLAAVSLLGHGLSRAVGEAKLLNLASNLAALMIFSVGDAVFWQAGLVMAGATMVGAWFGARSAITKGSSLIRPVLVVMSFAIAAKLLFDALSSSGSPS